ncbi:MAG: hypothetical protein ACRCXM_11470 [Beijerinckiaceae bacterium]
MPPVSRSYSHTPKPFGRQVTVTLGDGTVIVSDERKTLTAPLQEIAAIRLTYEPRNTLASGFKTKLTLSNRRTAYLTNIAWKSLVQVDRQDEPYRAFVTALVQDTARANPQVALIGGKPRPLWLAMLVISAATAAGLVFLAWRAFAGGNSAFALIILAFTGYFGFITADMLKRNRPRAFAPDAIPPDLLP